MSRKASTRHALADLYSNTLSNHARPLHRVPAALNYDITPGTPSSSTTSRAFLVAYGTAPRLQAPRLVYLARLQTTAQASLPREPH